METEAAAFAFNPHPDTRTVHFLVGPERYALSANEDLLRQHCSFIDYALTDDGRSSTDEPFELPTEDPDAFVGLLWWVHEGAFRHPDTMENMPSFHIMHMVKVWILAEKYSVPLLQECMISFARMTYADFEDLHDFPVDFSVLEYLSKHTNEDSHIRQLYLVFVAYSRPAIDAGSGRKVLLPFDDDERNQMPLDIFDEIQSCMEARQEKGNTLGWADDTDLPNAIMFLELVSQLDKRSRDILNYIVEEAVEGPLHG
ncbi:BTB/POZ domain containing protein [Macrophomina phaseolina MS6]|uniref:BTB/POZ domain containing protein n=1 Tax=Macrophomina phaseolina (strain MS6) TaxID=1126212 RepID=K2S6N1_MACPH|nr:BTB/POZ domain containing protein [Macrophomina phaseolina MS6]